MITFSLFFLPPAALRNEKFKNRSEKIISQSQARKKQKKKKTKYDEGPNEKNIYIGKMS